MNISLISPIRGQIVSKPVFKFRCSDAFKEAVFHIFVSNDISSTFLYEAKKGPYEAGHIFEFSPNFNFKDGVYNWYVYGEFIDLSVSATSESQTFEIKTDKKSSFVFYVIIAFLILIMLFRKRK